MDNNKLKFTFEQTTPNLKNLKYEIKNKQGIIIGNGIENNAKLVNNQIVIEIEKPKNLNNWDEFNPNLYEVKISNTDGETQTRFGFSKIKLIKES